jgi:hypothetical protein
MQKDPSHHREIGTLIVLRYTWWIGNRFPLVDWHEECNGFGDTDHPQTQISHRGQLSSQRQETHHRPSGRRSDHHLRSVGGWRSHALLCFRFPPRTGDFRSAAGRASHRDGSDGLFFDAGFQQFDHHVDDDLHLQGSRVLYGPAAQLPPARGRFSYCRCRFSYRSARRAVWIRASMAASCC